MRHWAPSTWALLPLVISLLLLVSCEQSNPEALAAGRGAIQALIAGDTERLAPYLAPLEQRPGGEVTFSPIASQGLQACRDLIPQFSDRSTNNPPGARIVTAKFTNRCVPNRPNGRDRDSIGVVVAPNEGRWLVVDIDRSAS